MGYLRAIAIISLLFSCSTGSPDAKLSSNESAGAASVTKDENLKQALIGEWLNVSMTINMKSVNSSGQDSISEVPEGQWEAILGIKPIRTVFAEDGTFRSEYRNLSDSVVFISDGKWELHGDSLSMTEAGSTNHYLTKVANGKAEFTGYIDWDQDGASDDLYFGVQKKF